MVGLKLKPDPDIPCLFNLARSSRICWFGCTTYKGSGGYWYHGDAYGYYKSGESILFIVR